MVVSVTPWNDIVGAVSKLKDGVTEGVCVCVCPWTTGVGACVGIGVATDPEGPGTAIELSPEGPNVSPIDLRYDGTSILFQICDSHLDRYSMTHHSRWVISLITHHSR